MDSGDYIADLEAEAQVLRHRVAELKQKIREVRDEARVARERKVEEIDEGVPPEEPVFQNLPKKEGTPGPGTIKRENKEEVERQIKPKRRKPFRDEASPEATRRESAVQTLREPRSPSSQGDDDDVVIVSSSRRPRGKRTGGNDQLPSPRPTKRQTFWVDVPPRSKRRVPPAPVKLE